MPDFQAKNDCVVLLPPELLLPVGAEVVGATDAESFTSDIRATVAPPDCPVRSIDCAPSRRTASLRFCSAAARLKASIWDCVGYCWTTSPVSERYSRIATFCRLSTRMLELTNPPSDLFCTNSTGVGTTTSRGFEPGEVPCNGNALTASSIFFLIPPPRFHIIKLRV